MPDIISINILQIQIFRFSLPWDVI